MAWQQYIWWWGLGGTQYYNGGNTISGGSEGKRVMNKMIVSFSSFFFWSYSSTAAPLPSFVVRFIFTCMPIDQVRASGQLGLGHCCVVVVAGVLLRHLKKYWDDLWKLMKIIKPTVFLCIARAAGPWIVLKLKGSINRFIKICKNLKPTDGRLGTELVFFGGVYPGDGMYADWSPIWVVVLLLLRSFVGGRLVDHCLLDDLLCPNERGSFFLYVNNAQESNKKWIDNGYCKLQFINR